MLEFTTYALLKDPSSQTYCREADASVPGVQGLLYHKQNLVSRCKQLRSIFSGIFRGIPRNYASNLYKRATHQSAYQCYVILSLSNLSIITCCSIYHLWFELSSLNTAGIFDWAPYIASLYLLSNSSGEAPSRVLGNDIAR